MKLPAQEARRRFGASPVACLASVRPDGAPHVVPVVFALDGDVLFTAVDHKPKRSQQLQRLANLRAEPRCSVLVESYDPEWSRLWWVRADGLAQLIVSPGADHPGVQALVERYEAYRERPPTGTLVRIAVERWVGWSAAQGA